MFRDIRKRCTAAFEKHHKKLHLVGETLQKLGDVVPVAGSVVAGFGLICNYLGDVGEKNGAEAAEILADFESLMDYIDQFSQYAETWDEKQRKDSQLYAQIKTVYAAVFYWEKQIRNKETPKDLKRSIASKRSKIEQCLQFEQLAGIKKIERVVIEIKETVVEVRDDVKDIKVMMQDIKIKQETTPDPMKYYREGKHYLQERRFADSLKAFETYREALEKGDSRCRKPHEDSHLFYMKHCYEQLHGDDGSSITSMAGGKPTGNTWAAAWEEWQRKYGTPNPILPKRILSP